MAATAAFAQATPSRVTLSAAYALDAGGPLSKVQTVGYFAVRVDYRQPLATGRVVAIDYLVGVVPMALVLHNALGETHPINGGWGLWGTAARTTTYGAGLSPVGLRVGFTPAAAIAPVLHASAGLLVFTRPAPGANAHRVNLIGEAGLGARVRLGPRSELTLGFAFQHLSNTGWGEVNPGLDSKLALARVVLPFW